MAERAARRRGNRRKRRIAFAVVVTVLGLGALTAFGLLVERRRETDLRDPTEGVTAELRHRIPSEAPVMAFRDVAPEVGIVMRHGPGPRGRTLPEDTGSGLAWGDYDGDGDFDLYVVSFPGPLGEPPDPEGGNRLFRNDGRHFVEVGAVAGVADVEGFGMGASFADVDADDDLDLYVTNYGSNRLFRNLGNGLFEDVAHELGVDDDRWSIAAAWGDYDRDGRLDLYVTNYVDYDADLASYRSTNADWQGIPFSLNPNAFDPQPNSLYHQLPDGTFEEVALELGVSNPQGRSLAATFVDVDGDGWLDLYVANDVSPNALFHNMAPRLGDQALFEDWSAVTGTADPRGSMGISVGRLDGTDADALPDLFITHWVAQENALYQSLVGPDGRLEYRDRTRRRRLGEISTETVGWGSAFVDLDRDGRSDLAVANGSTLERSDDPTRLVAQPPFLFWNAGDRFYDLAPRAGDGLAQSYVARGLAAADYDADGDVDLALSVNRAAPLLLRNDTPGTPSWIAIRSRSAGASLHGARLEVESGAGLQLRWWGADVSYASRHADEEIFGLGEDREPVSLAVRWSDGRGRRLEGLPPETRVLLEP